MTIRDEIIALLDTVPALGQRNYSDNAPDNVVSPYTVYKDTISQTSGLDGDAHVFWWKWMGQVDLWFALSTEDETLLDSVVNALDNAPLSAGRGLAVQSALRVSDPLYDAGHTAITLGAVRAR